MIVKIAVCLNIFIFLFCLSIIIYRWIESKKKNTSVSLDDTVHFVSLKDAVKIISACDYYHANIDCIMWERCGITPNNYYLDLLEFEIVKEEITLYGKRFSSETLQKISHEILCKDLYRDLSFKKFELLLLVEKLKAKLQPQEEEETEENINFTIYLEENKLSQFIE